MDKVKLVFEWEKCSADMGQFRQQSQLFKPVNLFIEIEIEDDPKYIGERFDDGVRLTPEGAQEAKRILQKHLTDHSENHSAKEEDWDEDHSNDSSDW